MNDREKLRAALAELARGGWRETEAADASLRPPADLETAFEDGTLTRQVEFEWGGGVAADVQVAFHRQGLALTIELTGTEGAASLSPSTEPSGLHRIIRAFDGLAGEGFAAVPSAAFTATDGWAELASRRDGSPGVLFWTTQSHEDAFDDSGDLVADLDLQWEGDRERIATALRTTGYEVIVPESAEETFTVVPEE